MPRPATLWTIGHSNHAFERFLALVRANDVEAIADVRSWEQRRLLTPADASIEERLRRGQRLSAQAAALRRAIVRDDD